MDEKMKQALLEWCEKHAGVLNNDFCDALDDLISTVVSTTETPIDDALVTPIKGPVIKMLREYLASQIDKIDGQIGE